VASFFVENSYAEKAQLIQRVEYDAASASLLGEPGPLVGSPQRMIIEDPKAFVEGKGPEGSRLVDDKYLREHNVYPLQLKTVTYLAGITRWGCASAIAVAVLLIAWARRRKKGRKVA